ncbi:MAG TPA: tyrosine-type recombinase/integrase [Streptosporangiaceae bacterium]|nr:tyrosine-type recombinase/integrase [Streptosporangiaceae bacterium]
MHEVGRYEPVPAGDGGRPAPEQLILRWLITKRSPHTRFGYGRDLGVRLPRPGATRIGDPRPAAAPDWLAWCRSVGIDPLAGVSQEHIGAWARTMEAAGLSGATVARRLAAVSSWYAWMREQGHVPANPAEGLARPQLDADTSTTPGLTKDQALRMLSAADSARWPQAVRNAALAALLLFTGARVSEACGATLADLSMDRGHRVLLVKRKGAGKKQPLALPAPALERLDAYLAGRGDLERLPAVAGTAGRERPLIATASGQPMRPADVWALMRRLGRAAKLPPELVGKMGAHSMRHSFATLYLDSGGSLRDLQDAMGHKDPRTTRRYDRARGLLDRSPGYKLAEYLSGGAGDE